MAARLFAAQSWISALCGLFLLMVFNRADDQTLMAVGRAVLRWVVAGILLALLIEWGIAPRILAARLDGQSLRLWHSLGSGMLLVQWLCVCALMWRLSCRP